MDMWLLRSSAQEISRGVKGYFLWIPNTEKKMGEVVCWKSGGGGVNGWEWAHVRDRESVGLVSCRVRALHVS